MAAVKPTQLLWASIDNNIAKMFTKRMAYAEDWTNYGLSKVELERVMYDEALPLEERNMINDLGEKYFTKHEQLDVSISGCTYKLPLKPSEYLPDKLTGWNGKVVLKGPQIIAIAECRREAIKKINADKEAFIKQVKSAFDSAPSINTLLKVWPPILDLLPQSAIDKVNKKVTTRRDLAKTFDERTLNGLSGHLLKAKVSQ